MNNQAIDFLIILTVKFLLLIGFITLIKFWIKKNKKKNSTPMIVYWVLGIFFVLMLSSHIFEALLYLIPLNERNSTLDRESLSSLGYLLGLIFYVLIGIKYLKNSRPTI